MPHFNFSAFSSAFSSAFGNFVTKTIGVSGADYDNPILWVAGEAGDFTADNLIRRGNIITDIPMTAPTIITGATISESAFWLLTVADADRHSGVAGTGKKLDISAWAHSGNVTVITPEDPHTIVDGFEIDGGGVDAIVGGGVEQGISIKAINGIVSNMIIHGLAATRTFDSVGGIQQRVSSGCTIYNNIVYDLKITASGTITVESQGININFSNALCYNNTVFDVDQPNATVKLAYGFLWNTTATGQEMKNNIAMGNGLKDYKGGTFGGVASNNMSSDATAEGANPIINSVTADQFNNITPGSENLLLKVDSDAINVALDLSGVFTTDIIDTVRPSGPAWDRGANERIQIVGFIRNLGNIRTKLDPQNKKVSLLYEKILT